MDKTPSQCREKIKKLKTIYRNINNNGKVSRKVRGRLVQKLHQVMGGLPVTLSSSEKDSSEIMVNQSTAVANGQEEMNGCDVQHQQQREAGIATHDDFAANFQDQLDGDFMGSASSSSEDDSSSDEDEQGENATAEVAATSSKSKRPEKWTRRSRKRARRSPVYVLMDKFIERFASLEER